MISCTYFSDRQARPYTTPGNVGRGKGGGRPTPPPLLCTQLRRPRRRPRRRRYRIWCSGDCRARSVVGPRDNRDDAPTAPQSLPVPAAAATGTMTCGGRRLSPSYYRHHRRRCRHTGDPQHSRRGLNHQHDHRNHHHYHHNYYRHHHHRHHHHHHHHHQHDRHGRGQSRLRAAVATDSRARLPYLAADAVAPSDATPLPLPTMRHSPTAARRHSSSSSSAAVVRRMSAWLVACVAFWAPSTPCTHAA